MKRAIEDSIDTLHKLKVIGKKRAQQYKRATGTLHKGYNFSKKVYTAYKNVKPSRKPGPNRMSRNYVPGPRGRGRSVRGRMGVRHKTSHYKANNHKLVNPVSAGIRAMRGAANRNTRNSHTNHGGIANITVPHKEIMDNVWTTGGYLVPQLRYGNPLQTATCPFGSQLAACYGMMQWVDVVVRFKTAADMQTRGNVYIAAVLNVESFTLTQFKTPSGFTNTEDHRIVAAYQDFQMSVNLASAVRKLQTYGGSPTAIEDQTSVFGFIVVYATDVTDDNSGDVAQTYSLGTLYIEYIMKLMQPRTALFMTSYVVNNGEQLGNGDGSFALGPTDGSLLYLSAGDLSSERSVFTPIAIDSVNSQWVFLTDFQGLIFFSAIGTGFTQNPTDSSMAFSVLGTDFSFSMLTVAGDTTQQTGTYWIQASKGIVVTPILYVAGFSVISSTSLTLLPSGINLTNGQPQVLSTKMKKLPKAFEIGKQLSVSKHCPFNSRQGRPSRVTGEASNVDESDNKYEHMNDDEHNEDDDYLRFLYERSKRNKERIKSKSPTRIDLENRNERLNGNNGSVTGNDDHFKCERLNGCMGSHTSMDDHLVLLLILLLVSKASAVWPTTTTSVRPTRQPVTPLPTYAPRPANKLIGRVDYTLAVFQGEPTTPLSSYYDSSPYPILSVHNGTTFKYTGRFTPPLNISISFSVAFVNNGYYSFRSAGAPTKVIGRTCTYNNRQTAMFFWMINDPADIYLTMTPPADSNDILGLLQASFVNNIPGFYSVFPIVGPTLVPTTASPTSMLIIR